MRIYIVEDKEHVTLMREKLKENENYCPCKIDRTIDTLCPCTEFRNQTSGTCHCGLYYKK